MAKISAATRRDVVWIVTLVLLLATVWVAKGDPADAGIADPEGLDRVYVAVADNFPDALGIASGAALYGAPVILVPTNPPLPSATSAELARLDPKEIIIIGGPAAVSSEMESAINDLLPGVTIDRIAGTNRYGTNTGFSETVFPYLGWVSLPPAAFTAEDPTEVSLGSGEELSSTAFGSSDLYAPLALPHGAEILGFEVTGEDNDGGAAGPALGDDIKVTVQRVGTGGGFTTFDCGNNTSGSPGEFTESCEFSGPVKVDNQNWAYFVIVEGADGDPFVEFVAVEYRLGVPTPDVIVGP